MILLLKTLKNIQIRKLAWCAYTYIEVEQNKNIAGPMV